VPEVLPFLSRGINEWVQRGRGFNMMAPLLQYVFNKNSSPSSRLNAMLERSSAVDSQPHKDSLSPPEPAAAS
jgi:hypothetical protein